MEETGGWDEWLDDELTRRWCQIAADIEEVAGTVSHTDDNAADLLTQDVTPPQLQSLLLWY